jgi:hypothetical protein
MVHHQVQAWTLGRIVWSGFLQFKIEGAPRRRAVPLPTCACIVGASHAYFISTTQA